MVSTLAAQANGRATWSRDGVILYENQNKLYRVTEAAGTPQEVMAPDAKLGEVALNWPYFLPDGHRYLVLARNSDPTKSAVLLTAHSNVDYAGGYLFYQNDGTLVACRFDADTGKLIGDMIQIQENIRYNAANGRSA